MINFNNTTADLLKKKSDRILGVFTKTKEDLATLNQEAVNYRIAVDEKISALEYERTAVSDAITENSNIIKKIEAFLK